MTTITVWTGLLPPPTRVEGPDARLAPGKYGVLATLPVLALAFWFSLRGAHTQASARELFAE